MNQHLPPENVREFVQPIKSAEQFLIVRGTRRGREPYLEDSLMSRFEVVANISEDVEHLRQIIAFSLETGSCRDATDEITSIVIRRWSEDAKVLTPSQKEFVAMCKGEAFANAFRVENV